jgi:hypothetical protein
MRHLVFIGQPQPFHLPGQLGLIEDTDGPAISLIKADAAKGDAVDLHGGLFKADCAATEQPAFGRVIDRASPVLLNAQL